jgi:hypothetical protein
MSNLMSKEKFFECIGKEGLFEGKEGSEFKEILSEMYDSGEMVQLVLQCIFTAGQKSGRKYQHQQVIMSMREAIKNV